MTELSELYQEVILDHNRAPHNFGALPDADARVEGRNPLCGDHLTLYVKFSGDKIADIRFTGDGCAISKASASLMTSALKGKSKSEADALFQKFHHMVTAEPHSAIDPGLGKLAVFSGVCEFPARVKCASLAWHSLHAALEGQKAPVSTE